jgi:hypothetical protein
MEAVCGGLQSPSSAFQAPATPCQGRAKGLGCSSLPALTAAKAVWKTLAGAAAGPHAAAAQERRVGLRAEILLFPSTCLASTLAAASYVLRVCWGLRGWHAESAAAVAAPAT